MYFTGYPALGGCIVFTRMTINSPFVQVKSAALVFLPSTLQTSEDSLLQNSVEDSEASKKVRMCKHNYA